MTVRIETERDEKLHKLHHDVQNCLNVISMGVDVLRDSRNDDGMFAEFHEIVQEQRRLATKLLDEYLHTACEACDADDERA